MLSICTPLLERNTMNNHLPSSYTLHADEYLEVDSDDDFVYEEVSYPNLITPLHPVTFSLHIL